MAGYGAAAAATMLDRPERKGLIRRRPDAKGRRRVLVEVTDELARQAAAIHGPIAEEGLAALRDYRIVDLRLLTKYFADIVAMTERHRRRKLAEMEEGVDV